MGAHRPSSFYVSGRLTGLGVRSTNIHLCCNDFLYTSLQLLQFPLPMTILDALRWANNQLKKTGLDSPMLDAEVLLAHTLQTTRAKLFARFNDPLKPHEQEKFLLLTERRAQREPVAYLTGRKPFYGRDFTVNPFVLIPRPETETLIEAALDVFATTDDKERVLIADIGTGSGAVAVTLAKETGAPVIAVDTSERALAVARANAQVHNAADLIDFQSGDLLDPLFALFNTLRRTSPKPVSSVYPFKHLILCANLPYLSTAQMETLLADVTYEPKEALHAGSDGLEAYFRLIRQLKKGRAELPRRLTLLIEIDPSQSSRAVQLIAHEFPSADMETKKGLQGAVRVVCAEV